MNLVKETGNISLLLVIDKSSVFHPAISRRLDSSKFCQCEEYLLITNVRRQPVRKEQTWTTLSPEKQRRRDLARSSALIQLLFLFPLRISILLLTGPVWMTVACWFAFWSAFCTASAGFRPEGVGGTVAMSRPNSKKSSQWHLHLDYRRHGWSFRLYVLFLFFYTFCFRSFLHASL